MPGTTRGNPSFAPERYLAIAAGAYILIDRIPDTAYPIADWEALGKAAASIGEVALRGPEGTVALINELGPTISYVRPILGDHYFPVNDADDLAHKAGMALVALVVRRHAPKPAEKPADPQGLAEIKALQQKMANQKRS